MRLSAAFLSVLVATVVLSAAAAQPPGSADKAKSLAALRKQLADPKPQVRLQAAVALAALPDEQAIGVLIDLLAELSGPERRLAEQTLQQLAGGWAPNPTLPGDDEVSRKIRKAAWAAWWRTLDGPTLLTAFRQRTLSKEELPTAQALVQQLADKSSVQRERAAAELIALGPKVVGLLRAALKSPDEEQARRAELCLKQIALQEAKEKLPWSAPRLLAARQPKGASQALLAYLAFCEDRLMRDEIARALTSLIRSAGQPDPAVVEALSDPLPVCRAAAAEALAAAGAVQHWPAVRKLLRDADADVRLRAAVALVEAQDKEAVPALIELLAELPRGQSWQAEELLRRLAGAKSPSVPWGKDDAAARKQLRDAWQAWWKEHGAAVNMAELEKTRGTSGMTLVVETALAGGPAKGMANRLVALDRNGQPLWRIDNLGNVFDFQLLPGDRVLIAEYTNKCITERDFQGTILWQVANLPALPVNVQRLANGNTFIALYGPLALNGAPLMEVDANGKTVATYSIPGDAGGMPGPKFKGAIDYVLAARKTADGKMVCLLYDGSCVWLDATGKELKRFLVPRAKLGAVMNTLGNIAVTPTGNVVFAQSDNTVVEFDMNGKMVWQGKAAGHHATRLANGNTLVASPTGVVEVDNAGQTVWHYDAPAGFQVVRAQRP